MLENLRINPAMAIASLPIQYFIQADISKEIIA
jgi:hypothetical protein